MNRRLRKELRTERARRLNRTARNLLRARSGATATDDLDWVGQLSRLRQFAREPTRAWWTIGIGVCSVLLVALAWSFRIPRAHFIADIEVRSLQIALADDWMLPTSLALDRVVVEGMSEIGVPGSIRKELASLEGAPSALEIRESSVVLDQLLLAGEPVVDLGLRGLDLELSIQGGSVGGVLHSGRAEMTLERGSTRVDVVMPIGPDSPPETITFDRSEGGALPALIRLRTRDAWEFNGLRVTKLTFHEEVRAGSGAFCSTVISGSIKALETGESVALEDGDRLVFDGVRTKRLILSNSENGIHMTFEGSASSVLAGPERFETNMKPTVLAYLYHQQPLAIIWSGVVFLFGLIWRIRGALITNQ